MKGAVSRKTEVRSINATPDKRIYWSIISDYDLKTGLCELVDNAIDQWSLEAKKQPLLVSVVLDVERQRVSIEDNAGGVPDQQLRLLVSPGGSRNSPADEIIGVFGVGSKRACVALGAHVEIRTRYKSQSSFQIDVTDDWLTGSDWDIPSYSIPDISPSTTRIDISTLRRSLTPEDLVEIESHLGETYDRFLEGGCEIRINGQPVVPRRFNTWAYPPGYPPRRARLDIPIPGLPDIYATVEAGLIRDRDPQIENYGVYVYCNDRLISKELRSRDVGYYVTSEAGVPHPDASLARVIVSFNGAARGMPWNSSKSAINVSHPTFEAIRPTIIQLNSYFTSLSRRTKDDWDGKVTRFSHGEVVETDPVAPGTRRRLDLPELPRVNKPLHEALLGNNKAVLSKQPWTLGLVEALGAVDVVVRQRFDTKNRIALILLDSNFEIALKEYIVHREDLFPKRTFTDAYISTLFKNRADVLNAVTRSTPLPADHITKASHYYLMRNKLIHERATVGITDEDVRVYRQTVEAILKKLFGLRF
jgi:hypothetical protein